MTRRLRRIGPWALAVAAGEAVVGYAAYWLNEVFFSNLEGPDFFAYYAIARLQLERGPAHVYDLALQKLFEDQVTAQWAGDFILLPHLLPPYATLFLAPFGLLPFRVAYGAWGLIVIALVAGGVVALLRAGRLSGRTGLLFGLLAAAYFPVFALVLQGQSDDAAVFGLGLAALAWTRGRPALAGLAASLALIKPQLILLVPALFLIRSPLRAFPAFVGAALALVVGSLPFFGIDGWRAYLNLVVPWLSQGHAGFPIEGQSAFSLRGALEHLPFGSTATLAILALLLLCVAASFFVRPARPRVDFALAVAASVALSSYVNAHDLVLLLVPSLLLSSLLLDGDVTRPRIGWAALAFSYVGVDLYLVFGAVPAAAGVITLAVYLLSERLTPAAPERRLSSPIRQTQPESTASVAALPR